MNHWKKAALAAAVFLVAGCGVTSPGDWPELRQNPRLTGIQPLAGSLRAAPSCVGSFDLGRSVPSLTAVAGPNGDVVGIGIVANALRCFNADGTPRWTCHPPGLNFTALTAAGDLDGDGKTEALLSAGRPGAPYGAAALVSLDDGRLLWRCDIEPMSYVWYLHTDRYLPGTASKQIVVLMQGYPPDPKNGYIALFAFDTPGAPPVQKWRYDFSEYTCFPTLLTTDLDGDGAREIAVQTHSRMWLLDAATGALKQFCAWDVSPANVRSYGHTAFTDLDGDGREDFLCIANFAQHHEVLLNRGGALEKAWSHGWPESVTTGKVSTVWAEPPQADVDGDGGLEIVLSMHNSESENAWLLRVYDAVTGALKYRVPGVIAAACADTNGDGAAEILTNASSDPTGTALSGARLYAVRGGAPELVWRDATAKAVAPLPDAGSAGAPVARVERDGGTHAVVWDGEGVSLRPWTPPPSPPAPVLQPPPAVAGPPFPSVLAADVNTDGVNEVLLFQEPRVRVLSFSGGVFAEAGEFSSSCEPVVADLDGDAKAEVVTALATPTGPPVVEAVTPALGGRRLWRTEFPAPDRAGLPQPRKAYLRTGRFTGRDAPDLYLWAGTPVVRSAALDGATGRILWDKGETPGLERYWGPSVNLASVIDFDGDGKEDLVFTNPDYYCVASGPTGEPLFGPLFPPDIFKQPSQGLYTFPAILAERRGPPTVCLVSGHYFQGAMSLRAAPHWHALPAPGDNRTACEAFLRLSDGAWLMGFGRQNGNFACVNVSDGSTRWELPVQASCSDPAVCDVDGDGTQEFVFGTSHGALLAVGDDRGRPRVLWTVDVGAGAGAPVIADITGDGKVEIVLPTADGWVHMFGAE